MCSKTSLASEMSILFSRKRWIFDSDEDPNQILQKVEEFIVAGSHDDYKKLFAERSAAEFVVYQIEKTSPPGAFSCLETIFQTGEHAFPCRRNVSASRGASARKRVEQ